MTNPIEALLDLASKIEDYPEDVSGRDAVKTIREATEALEARLAEADKANQLLRADLAAAAREEDLILLALRLDPERYRTECGYLNVPKIIAAIKNPNEYPRIADSAPAALDLERVDIHRCPTCGALPRPSLMGGTVCPNGHGNVSQQMPTGSADPVIHAQHEETGRLWTGPRSQLPRRYFECVTDAEYEAQMQATTATVQPDSADVRRADHYPEIYHGDIDGDSDL